MNAEYNNAMKNDVVITETTNSQGDAWYCVSHSIVSTLADLTRREIVSSPQQCRVLNVEDARRLCPHFLGLSSFEVSHGSIINYLIKMPNLEIPLHQEVLLSQVVMVLVHIQRLGDEVAVGDLPLELKEDVAVWYGESEYYEELTIGQIKQGLRGVAETQEDGVITRHDLWFYTMFPKS